MGKTDRGRDRQKERGDLKTAWESEEEIELKSSESGGGWGGVGAKS